MVTKKKKQKKTRKLYFYRGTYTTGGETQADAERNVDAADRKTTRITFGMPKRYGRGVSVPRITPKMPKLR